MNTKSFFVALFFLVFIMMLAGAALGDMDLTPDTPPEPSVNRSGSSLSLMQQGAGGICASTYTVRSGDTLFRIARTCALTLPDLLAANPAIANPDLIRVGQVINIPRPPGAPGMAQQQPAPTLAPAVQEAPAAADTATPIHTAQVNPPNQPAMTDSTQAEMVNEAFATARAQSQPTTGPTSTPAGSSQPGVILKTGSDGYQPGASLEVVITGFRAGETVNVGIGQFGQEAVPVGEKKIGADGSLTILAGIPTQAQAGQVWTVIVVSQADASREATADPFMVGQ